VIVVLKSGGRPPPPIARITAILFELCNVTLHIAARGSTAVTRCSGSVSSEAIDFIQALLEVMFLGNKYQKTPLEICSLILK
jgi:hypothetical protein